MSNCVYYHHPTDSQYSLTYVTKDRDTITNSGQNAIIERCECNSPFFILYTNHGASGDVDNLQDDFDDVLDEMSPPDRIMTLRLLQIFEGIIEEKKIEEDEKLEIYKQIELGQIPDAIAEIDWELTAVDVAGQILSSLILKHPLPNANHRASISFAEWYLESTQFGFSLPTLATEDYEWQKWVNEYIVESKRLLTVRRNTTAFSMLQQWGCDIIKRKGDIDIVLSKYDLDYPRSEALREYGKRHRELCTELIIESVQRAGYDDLLRTNGPTKSEFADYLEQSE